MPALLQEQQRERAETSAVNKRRDFSAAFCRVAIAAAIVFATINAAFAILVGDDKTSTDVWGGTGSIDLAVNDYARLPYAPSVVLLGSSLMMFPFWALDKERNPGIGDIFHHHNAQRFEDYLGRRNVWDVHIFNFAIFGQMVSDAYIVANEYLKGNKTPRYVIYGTAPRDFSDYDLQAPMATLTFKRLVNLSNFQSYAFLYLPELQQKLDFVLGHACYFYGRRWKLQHEVDRGTLKLYSILGIAAQAPALVPGTAAASSGGFSMTITNEKERWENSAGEYARRYKGIDQSDLSVQMGFLRRLFDVCRQRNIKVILVNMPLTDINRSLFPAGFYSRFRSELAVAARRPGVQFVDLGDSSDFHNTDFWDTSHLNQSGGHKLLDHLVPVLVSGLQATKAN